MPDSNTGEQHQNVSASTGGDELGHALAEQAIQEGPKTIEYLGVKLERGTGQEEQVPDYFADYIEDEFSQDTQQRLAIAFSQHQPTILEGGTSLGKSTTPRKMASELGWSVHYVNMVGSTEDEDLMGDFGPNPDKKDTEDAEFAFFDGPVTAAIEEAAKGHKVLLLIEEINAARPNVLIRLHEIIDAFEKSSTVNITKKGGKHLSVVRDNLNIVGLANPPSRGGSGYAERTPLDKAQFRRWNYQKLPDEMPEESFEHSVGAMFGVEPMSQKAEVDQSKFLHSGERVLSREELGRIPGMRDMAEQFKIFHTTMKGKLEAGLARDQPQPISYDDREEISRVTEFIAHFYNGDINATMHRALEYYYANKIADKTERASVLQLIQGIKVEITGDERRRSLSADYDTSDPETLSDPDYIAFKLNELLDKGAKDKTVLQCLAGNDSDNAWLIREVLAGKAGTIKDFGKSLAGIANQRASDERDRLYMKGRKAAFSNSMTGSIMTIDDMQTYILKVKSDLAGYDIQDKQAVLSSLAGLATNERQFLWQQLADIKNPRTLGEAFIGLRDHSDLHDRAQDLTLTPDEYVSALGWSYSGSDSEEAWNYRISKLSTYSCLISLGGLDTPQAWEIREDLGSYLDAESENPLALSISGVYSERAWKWRDEMFGSDPELYALSIGGNWVLNAVRAGEATNNPVSELNDGENEEGRLEEQPN